MNELLIFFMEKLAEQLASYDKLDVETAKNILDEFRISVEAFTIVDRLQLTDVHLNQMIYITNLHENVHQVFEIGDI